MGQTRSCYQKSQKYNKWLYCNFTVTLQHWEDRRAIVYVNLRGTGLRLGVRQIISYRIVGLGVTSSLCSLCVKCLFIGTWCGILWLLAPASPMTALYTTIDLNNHVSRLLKDTTLQGIQTYLKQSKLGQSAWLQNMAVCLTKGSLSVRGKLYLTYSLLIALMQFYEH